MTDPIADFLTRIRNAVKAGHKVVDIPGSKMKREMTKILKEKGYITKDVISPISSKKFSDDTIITVTNTNDGLRYEVDVKEVE